MELKDFSSCVSTSQKTCAKILNEILQDTHDYLATYPESVRKGFFSADNVSPKKFVCAHYEYAARLCRYWDRVAEHLLEIGKWMQECDANMDSEAVLRCDATLTKGREFRSALDQYLTQSEALLQTENFLPQLHKQTQRFLFATEQFQLFFTSGNILTQTENFSIIATRETAYNIQNGGDGSVLA